MGPVAAGYSIPPRQQAILSKLSVKLQGWLSWHLATLKPTAPAGSGVAQAVIAIVDDDPRIRALLCDELEDLGHRCLSCGSVQELLDGLSAEPPQLIFLDVMMPGTDGMACLELLQQRQYRGQVLMFSGLDDPELKQQALAAGACGWVMKAALFDQLPQLLRQHLPS